jgi:hypothetical protein
MVLNANFSRFEWGTTVTIMTVGVDLAKDMFSVHRVDEIGTGRYRAPCFVTGC